MPKFEGKNMWYKAGKDNVNTPDKARKALILVERISRYVPGGVLVVLPSTAWISEMKKIFHTSKIKKKPFFEFKNDPLFKNLEEFQK